MDSEAILVVKLRGLADGSDIVVRSKEKGGIQGGSKDFWHKRWVLLTDVGKTQRYADLKQELDMEAPVLDMLILK